MEKKEKKYIYYMIDNKKKGGLVGKKYRCWQFEGKVEVTEKIKKARN